MADAQSQNSAASGMSKGIPILGDIMSAQQTQYAIGDKLRTLLTEGIYEREARRLRASQISEYGNQVVSTQRTSYAKAGVEISSGTPGNVIAQTALDAERASLREVFEGDLAVSRSQKAAKRIAKQASKTAEFDQAMIAAKIVMMFFGGGA
jgi:hypothetical protein